MTGLGYSSSPSNQDCPEGNHLNNNNIIPSMLLEQEQQRSHKHNDGTEDGGNRAIHTEEDLLYFHRRTFAELIFCKASNDGEGKWSEVGDRALFYYDIFLHHQMSLGQQGIDALWTIHPHAGAITKPVMHDAAEACVHLAKMKFNSPILYEDTLYVLTLDEAIFSFLYEVSAKWPETSQVTTPTPGAYLQGIIGMMENHSSPDNDSSGRNSNGNVAISQMSQKKWLLVKNDALERIKHTSIEGFTRYYSPPVIAIVSMSLCMKAHLQNPLLSMMLTLLNRGPQNMNIHECELHLNAFFDDMCENGLTSSCHPEDDFMNADEFDKLLSNKVDKEIDDEINKLLAEYNPFEEDKLQGDCF